jgi:hypothetical protein
VVNDSHIVFLQKLLGEDVSVRRVVVMVKQTGLLLQQFGATSWHVYTQAPQNVAVEPTIHSLACWDKFFVHLTSKNVMIMLLTLLITCLAILTLKTWGFFTGRIVALTLDRKRKNSSYHQ